MSDAAPFAASFHELTDAQARASLLGCLDVPRWADELLAGRPYDDDAALLERARALCAGLTDDEVAQALSGHPRIGEKPSVGHNVSASQAEQRSVAASGSAVLEAIRVGNVAYERRFDRIFLVRAAGRSAEEVLEELTRRLRNSPEQEVREVAGQLGEITMLRLEQLLATLR